MARKLQDGAPFPGAVMFIFSSAFNADSRTFNVSTPFLVRQGALNCDAQRIKKALLRFKSDRY
jgi:hypothetical protein